MLKKIGLNSFLALLVASLVGCGFHLRGIDSNGVLPFQTAQLEMAGGVREDIQMAMQRQLNQASVKILDSQAAEVQIQLMPTQYKSSRTSSRLGDATSELIKMTQRFTVINLDSGEKVVSGESTVYRDRQINTSVALSSNSELRSIQKSMSEEIARQILDRIRRASLVSTESQSNAVSNQTSQ